jgi:hypothetical protein
VESLILLELASIHARHHARVEPTFLLIDEFLDAHHTSWQVAALERLQELAGHAQLAIISHSPAVVNEMSGTWTATVLDAHRTTDDRQIYAPIDFEIETSAAPPNPLDPEVPS